MVSMNGCGPNLTRPGFHPSPEPPVKSPLELFQEAEADVLSKLQFKFDYVGFAPLDGVAQEVLRVLYKYPPDKIGGTGKLLSLHANDVIDKEWKSYMKQRKAGNVDLECARDYRDLCPLGWSDLGDGMSCESPPSMFGNEPCRKVKFGQLSPLEKSQVAFQCGESVYPCLNECKYKDYSSVCPEGWTKERLDKEVCIAPSEYSLPCVHRYDFKNHSVKLKKKFEALCKVQWPCTVQSTQNKDT